MKSGTEAESPNCSICSLASFTKLPVTGKLIEHFPSLKIYTDVCGPIKDPEIGGIYFFVTYTVTAHRFVHVELMNGLDKVSTHCQNILNWVYQNDNVTVKSVHNNDAKELLSMARELKEKGVSQTVSTTYCPQSNSLAEQMNRILMIKVCAMMKQANVPWVFCERL